MDRFNISQGARYGPRPEAKVRVTWNNAQSKGRDKVNISQNLENANEVSQSRRGITGKPGFAKYVVH